MGSTAPHRLQEHRREVRVPRVRLTPYAAHWRATQPGLEDHFSSLSMPYELSQQASIVSDVHAGRVISIGEPIVACPPIRPFPRFAGAG